MKRHAKAAERRDRPADPGSVELRIEFDSEVLRSIRQHSRSSMSAEICGVLIGSAVDQATIVEASIPGEEARQGGSHVTFTQDTWTHIYQVKDSQYPDKRIVGWYHSHPGFGVFLSEHDTFIHRNFFSNANQVAWVFDPHSDEEGCFAWRRDEIFRVTEIAVRDRPHGRPVSNGEEAEEGVGRGPGGPPHQTAEGPRDTAPAARSRLPRIARWVGLVLSHLLALILGLGIGALLAPRVIMVPDLSGQRPGIAVPVPQVQPPAVPQEDRKK
jgi:proteasome lid subunit RPN8/RPN11